MARDKLFRGPSTQPHLPFGFAQGRSVSVGMTEGGLRDLVNGWVGNWVIEDLKNRVIW